MTVKFALTIVFFWMTVLCCGQSPSHYMIGKDQFAETDIYSITQDPELNIWISGSTGLYKYDGSTYQHYRTDAQLQSSLFSLSIGPEGKVWCSNLKGQLFHVKDDSLQLYVQIPDELTGTLLSYGFDDQGRIICSSTTIFAINKDKTFTPLVSQEKTRRGYCKFLSLPDGTLLLPPMGDFSSLNYIKDGVLQHQLLTPHLDKDYYQLFRDGDDVIAQSSHRSAVYRLTNGSTQKQIFTDEHQQEFASNSLDIADGLYIFRLEQTGARIFSRSGTPLYQKEPLFGDLFFSAFLNDAEGNWWLPTFGDGIMIIPNRDITDYGNHPLLKEEQLTAMEVINDSTFVLGSRSGKLFLKTGTNISTLPVHSSLKIEFLSYHAPSNTITFNDTLFTFVNLSNFHTNRTNMGTVKAITYADHQAITGSSVGIRYNSSDTPLPPHNTITQTKKRDIGDGRMLISKTRTNSLLFHDNNLWAGTTKGLQLYSGAVKREITFEGEQISAVGIEEWNGDMYVATFEQGLLRMHDNEWTSINEKNSNLPGKTISSMHKYDNALWMLMENGTIARLDSTMNITNFGTRDGIAAGRINDFSVSKGSIYLIVDHQLQIVPIASLTKNEVQPVVEISKIIGSNGELTPDHPPLAYNLNKIEFQFVAKAFKHRGALSYSFRLLGLDTTWTFTSSSDHKVTFNALPYGDFEFQVRAFNEHGIESKTVHHTFSVQQPYFTTWWFYLLIGLAIMGLVSLFFTFRIKEIRKKNELLNAKQQTDTELIESRLMALRSQMNPHFMFNALNSIQEYIILSKKELASEYLGMFADLMRIYLNHSRSKEISLAEEIDALKLYLELEQVRFEEDFSSNILVDEALDLHNTLIPTFLIQPYVENAVKHGLLHIKGAQTLTVEFSKSTNENVILAHITDNGIGRTRSADLGGIRNKNHESFATNANQSRLSLLNLQRDLPIGVETKDAYPDDGEGTGTVVVVRIPFH